MQDARQDEQHETQPHPNSGPSYIGDTDAELLAVEWDGFERGYADAADVGSAPETADQIVEAAGRACARTLAGYVFLNREAFHRAYTHGWIAGYLAAQRGWRRP